MTKSQERQGGTHRVIVAKLMIAHRRSQAPVGSSSELNLAGWRQLMGGLIQTPNNQTCEFHVQVSCDLQVVLVLNVRDKELVLWAMENMVRVEMQ